uniref:ATP synthase F0 subunit 8 n=1 Tax=Mazarredia convexa TaxID=1634147 RepID=A0A7G7WR14_9ORTH|nr:ATP synthase F0 subunit 8 [Mazarredia convexa]
MPQMSNIMWLPLMLYFSTIMITLFSMMFSMLSINKKAESKKPWLKQNKWQW